MFQHGFAHMKTLQVLLLIPNMRFVLFPIASERAAHATIDLFPPSVVQFKMVLLLAQVVLILLVCQFILLMAIPCAKVSIPPMN